MSATTAIWLRRIRQVWVAVGFVALVSFIGWSLVAYQASAAGRAGLVSDPLVSVSAGEDHWNFQPAAPRPGAPHLVFLPGALVDPAAYAPLVHALASHGYPGHLFAMPWRGAFGRADGEEFRERLRSFMDSIPGDWVVAGHSRGAKIAALLARATPPRLVGLISIGSTHPRDFSLAASPLMVTKIYATHDGLAPAATVLAHADLLPASTRWVGLEGGNHSQFGYYGFQPGDHLASMSREDQHAATLAAMLEALDRSHHHEQ